MCLGDWMGSHLGLGKCNIESEFRRVILAALRRDSGHVTQATTGQWGVLGTNGRATAVAWKDV